MTTSHASDDKVVLRTILCPIDFSDFSQPVLACAVALAKLFGSDVTERHIDLIVMGTHGLSGLDRFALGSVAEKVLRKAQCQSRRTNRTRAPSDLVCAAIPAQVRRGGRKLIQDMRDFVEEAAASQL
jgi:hypothetical protein